MCVAVISAAAASAQIRIVSQDRLEEGSSPRLSADSAYLRFDVTHIAADPMNEDDSPQTYEYAFTNEGLETLHIERLVSTCSCASATCSVKDVEPGQRAEVRVRYNPKGHPGRFERKVFVYTQKGNAPAAVLRLSVDVSSGAGLSAEWPVQMGPIRLRRSEVSFEGVGKAVETIRFKNVGEKPVELQCETAFLPECLEFSTVPETLQPGAEGRIRIAFDPSRPGIRETMKIILKSLGLPPSKSTITVVIPSSPDVIPSSPDVIPSSPDIIPSSPDVIPSEVEESK